MCLFYFSLLKSFQDCWMLITTQIIGNKFLSLWKLKTKHGLARRMNWLYITLSDVKLPGINLKGVRMMVGANLAPVQSSASSNVDQGTFTLPHLPSKGTPIDPNHVNHLGGGGLKSPGASESEGVIRVGAEYQVNREWNSRDSLCFLTESPFQESRIDFFCFRRAEPPRRHRTFIEQESEKKDLSPIVWFQCK